MTDSAEPLKDYGLRFRWWLLIAAGLFIFGLVLGLLAEAIVPESALAELIEGQIYTIEGWASILKPFTLPMTIFILIKNISAVLLSFIMSPIICLFPIASLITNGSMIAYVSALIIPETSVWYLLAGLLPHGVLELPAIIIGEAAALSFGWTAFSAIFNQEKRQWVLPNLIKNAWYLVIACLLLVPAAIIETFVTPLLLR